MTSDGFFFGVNICHLSLICGTAVAITLCFLPIMASWQLQIEVTMNSAISIAFRSFEYNCTLVTSIFLSYAVLLEMALDVITFGIKEIFSQRKFYFNWILVLSLLVPDMLLLLYVTPHFDYRFYAALYYSRLILVFAATSSYIVWNEEKDVLSQFQFGILYTTFILASTVSSFYCYLAPVYGKALLCVAMCIGSIVLILFYYSFGKWLRKLYLRSCEGVVMSTDQYCCCIYIFFSSVVVVGLFILIARSIVEKLDINDTDNEFLVGHNAFYSFFYILVPFFNNRATRRELLIKTNELSAKKMFVRYISHEIRTPLNTVIMGLRALKNDVIRLGAPKELLVVIADLKTSTDIAVNTLNELLEYDKLREGILILEKTYFSAIDFIKESLMPFYLQARDAGVTLRLDTLGCNDLTSLTLYADKNKLAQVIRNLASNGLKFTPRDGTVDVIVTVQTVPDTETYELSLAVKDSGAGISQDNQGKLFKSIVQFNPGKLQGGGGSGLGLFISNGIIGLHGGKLTVWSAGEGSGCTFTATIPVLLCDPDQASGDQGDHEVAALQAHMFPDGSVSESVDATDMTVENVTERCFAGLHVMVVDDVALNRKMLVRNLIDHCAKMYEDENGQNAVDRVKGLLTTGQPLNLILMDFQMPIMDGPTATRMIRAAGYSELLVGVTGNALQIDIDIFNLNGADDVLVKPLDIDRLAAIVKRRQAPMARI